MINVKKLSSFADLVSFDKEPVPFFQSVQYLQVFAENFSAEQNLVILGIVDNDKLIGYGAFEKVDGKIVFLGMKHVLNDQELTDYGDIFVETRDRASNDESQASVGSIDGENKYAQVWISILNWFKENGFHDVQLDYVREDSSTYKYFFANTKTEIPDQQLQNNMVVRNDNNIRKNPFEIRINPELQETAPYIILPKNWEEYVNGLEYHSRRELRRKINRLDKDFGGRYTTRCFESSSCPEAELQKYFAEFIRLVKLSENEKENFMSEKMVSFFHDLIFSRRDAQLRVFTGWTPCLNFLEIEGKNVASILTFENGVESLAYNSGYDPAYKFYSVGFLVHAFKIRDLISRGYKKYDFLRGSERYKFDLGGKEERLYNVNIKL